MGTYFLTNLRDILSDAGVATKVEDVNEGWETRSRSSGGFNGPPLGVIAHHTASNTSPQNDLNWMIHGSDDAPIGNMLLAGDGVVWPIAAGASNCAGKGGPVVFSRGTVTKDSGNSMTWNIEAANSGVGEAWTVQQIDAYFASINALNKHFGNISSDLETHQSYAPDRKIDPATAAAVQGSWRPASVTSSGTWSLADLRAECERRWPITIPPQPPTGGDKVSTTFTILDPPIRILDTRDTAAGKMRDEGLTVTVPMGGDAVGAAVTITLAGAEEAGHATAWASGAEPEVSCVNVGAGQTMANTTVVPVEDGKFKVQVHKANAWLIVDLVGIYGP